MNKIDYLHIEISTLCNAACPCCPRFNSNSPLVREGLDLGYIDIEKFKNWFPPEVLSRVEKLTFCGNHGDPGTNPDFPAIVEYLSQFNFFNFEFHTNGGMKKPSFWKKLAHACNKCNFPVRPIFSIDGLKDTNHIYRRNVDWYSLMDNVKAFISVFEKKEYLIWDYLVFKHNEHQLVEAKKLATELGINTIYFKHPLNLDDGENITPIPSLGKDGNILYWIDPSDLKRFRPSYLSPDAKTVKNNKQLLRSIDTWTDRSGVYSEEDKKELAKLERIKIIPRCKPFDLYVESDGTVHQCCYVANGFYFVREAYLKNKMTDIVNHQYLELRDKIGFDKFNLHHTTVKEIEDSKVLFKLLTDKWDSTVEDGKPLICASICGKKQGLDEVYETITTEASRDLKNS